MLRRLFLLAALAWVAAAGDAPEEGEGEGHGEKDDENIVAWSSLLIFFLVILSLLAEYFLKLYHVQVLHGSGAGLIIGLIAGAIVKESTTNGLETLVDFDETIFFLVLLPMIIVSEGYSMKRRSFFGNLPSILSLAVVGTLISTFVVSGFIYWMGQAGAIVEMPFVETLLFGSLISAVDPVTVLAVFKEARVDVTLNAIVFGESVLNDAVSLALTRTFSELEQRSGGSFNAGEAIGLFIGVFIGSFVIGAAIALLMSLLFKHSQLREHPYIEVALLLFSALVPYAIAEGAELSGIVALLFNAIFLSHYAWHCLSDEAKYLSKHFLGLLAMIAETAVFLLLGLSVFGFEQSFSANFVVLSIVACLVARALHVFPICFLLNRYRKKKSRISRRNQVVIWWSGLRGAIAFALAAGLKTEHRDEIVSATLGVVLFTVWVFGGTTFPLLKFLKVKSDIETTREISKEDRKKKRHWFLLFDEKYLRPIFTVPKRDKDDGLLDDAFGPLPRALGRNRTDSFGDDEDFSPRENKQSSTRNRHSSDDIPMADLGTSADDGDLGNPRNDL